MTEEKTAFHKLSGTLRLGRAIKLVWTCGPGWMVGGIAVILVQGLLPVGLLYLIKLIIDSVSAALSGFAGPEPFRQVAFLIALAAAVALLEILFRSLAEFINETQSLRLTDHVQSMIHARSIDIDLAYYEDSRYYDSLHLAQQSGAFRPALIVKSLIGTAQSAISLLAMTGLLLTFHWSLAVILLLVSLPGMFIQVKYADAVFGWERKNTPSQRLAYAYDWILTSVEFAGELRLFGLGRLFSERHRQLRDRLRIQRLDLSMKRVRRDFAAQAGSILLVFGSFAFIAYRAVQGLITLGDLVMFYQAFQRALGYLRSLLSGLAGLYEHNLFLANLEDFLNLEKVYKDPEHPVIVPSPFSEGIVLDKVGFSYPGEDSRVLEEVSFRIGSGELVALVGANGSGKTTLVKLLCGFYRPDHGSISVDGTDISDFRKAEWQKQLSVVFQNFARYPLSVRENIWLGDTDLSPEDDKVGQAAGRAGADDLIGSLPHGYETILGRQFEEGTELSVGEWQKIALARALIRDSQLIILDEPTSSMDPNAEYKVFNLVPDLLDGRSGLIISHRFSTVRMAHRIVVLENGRISEEGTHEELVALGGVYASLYRTQARFYHS